MLNLKLEYLSGFTACGTGVVYLLSVEHHVMLQYVWYEKKVPGYAASDTAVFRSRVLTQSLMQGSRNLFSANRRLPRCLSSSSSS
eukprot:3388710-Rhodomonas_salina.1